MGNKQAKKNNQLIDQERQRAQGQQDEAMSYLKPERHAAKKMGDSEREEVWNNYRRFASGEAFKGMGGGGSGGGGGYTPQTYNPEKAALSGYSREAAGGYRDFAHTGGWSSADQINFRNRANRKSDAFYDSLGGDIERQNRLSGGNLGFSASLSRLARQKAQAGQAAMTDAEIEMQGNIRQNKLHGLGGLAGVGGEETNLNMYNTDIENDARKYNVNEANQAAAAGAASSAAAARDAEAQKRWQMGMEMDANDRMADFYGRSPGEASRYDEMLARERGMTSDMAHRNIQTRMDYNPNVSAWDRAMQIGGLAVGGLGAFTGGGFGGKRPPTPRGMNTSFMASRGGW